MSNPDHPIDFRGRAERLLSRLEAALDRLSDEVDIDALRSGNVLTLAFENGHRIIVNTQEAIAEIWVAARSGGFHYRWNEGAGTWNDTRSGDDLRVVLARLIEIELGVAPALDL